MRIIAGFLKGRRLHVGKNLNVRPTTDFAKESLFNILNNKVDYEGLEVLDLFAGTGSISFEFISRGVNNVTAVEKSFKCVEYIRRNADILNIHNIRVLKMSAFDFIANSGNAYDIIFADPPYDLRHIPQIAEQVITGNILKPEGIFILEHSDKYNFADMPHFSENRKYGSVNFSFFAL